MTYNFDGPSQDSATGSKLAQKHHQAETFKKPHCHTFSTIPWSYWKSYSPHPSTIFLSSQQIENLPLSMWRFLSGYWLILLQWPWLRNLNWRYLPYIFGLFFRSMYGNIPTKYGQKYGTVPPSVGSWNSHWLVDGITGLIVPSTSRPQHRTFYIWSIEILIPSR